jgi:hypothetical protein
MRFAAAAILVAASPVSIVHAEPLPSGSIGLVIGAVAGTGGDASRLGVGYVEPPFSFQASWQPMTTERRVGWTARWTTLFSTQLGASAATAASDLKTTQMDLTLGARIRPGESARRYVTLRGGGAFFRANQAIPPKMQRAFVGPTASIGLQQYFLGTRLLVDVDIRYGLIEVGPTGIAMTIGLSIAGP